MIIFCSNLINVLHCCVCRFLHILQLLVGEGSGGDRIILSSVIQFTMKQIYPIVAERPAPDIKAVLFDLLFQLLLNNWRSIASLYIHLVSQIVCDCTFVCYRYFFPHTVLSHMEGDEAEDVLEHREEFFTIMEVWSHCHNQPISL